LSAAQGALDLVPSEGVVGLGSGRAASAFVRALGRRVAEGLRVRGVPTSEATRQLAASAGIPLVGLDQVESIDLAVDGADELDPAGDLIKGYGGALLREKIVAGAAAHLVILVGPEKLVSVLGKRGRLPVEVLPFAEAAVRRRLEALGYPAQPRTEGGRTFVTDNGNHVLDCAVPALRDPGALDAALHAIPGVLETGLFLGMADTILVDRAGHVEVRRPDRG
jgi:ribose 5-phosphate isomerase A